MIIYKYNMVYFLCLALLMSGCERKELPEDHEGPVKIQVQASFDGAQKKWEAGRAGIYNYTEAIENEFGYYDLHSSLATTDGRDDFFEVIILDNSNLRENYLPEERYVKGARNFMDQGEMVSSYTFRFHALPGDISLIDHEWFNQQRSSYEVSPEFTFEGDGAHLICLKGVTEARDTIHSCKRIYVAENEMKEPKIWVERETEDSITLAGKVERKVCDDWIWDGVSYSSAYCNWPKEYIQQEEVHNVQFFQEGKLVSDVQFLLTGEEGSKEVEVLDFWHESVHREVKDHNQHTRVIINYFTEENGLYSTRFASANENRQFEILNVEAFEENENGTPTVLIEFQGDAILSTEFGETIEVSGLEGTMAFPHPGE